jgi:hypothetical protein
MRYTQPIFRFYRNPLDPTSPVLSMEFYSDSDGSWYEHRMSLNDALRFCQRLTAETVAVALNNPKLRDQVRPALKPSLLQRILGR